LLALALSLLQAQPTREERVLELVRGLQHESGSGHYSRSRFERAPAPFGERSVFVAHYLDEMCLNSDEGTVTGARARRASLELCSIFGLALEPDRLVAEGEKSAVLDGLDPARRIAFELRGLDDMDWNPEPLLEVGSAALDASEYAWFAAQGYRVFVADLVRYRKLDGDEFTHTLAYLAGLVAFLDDVTDGEDVALGGLTFEREATWDWKKPIERALPGGLHWGDPENAHELVADRATRFTLHCGGRSELGPPISDIWELHEDGAEERMRSRSLGSSTRGAPSVLVLGWHAARIDGQRSGDPPTVHIRVRQRQGETEFVHETDRFTAFFPSTFDLAQPFDVDFELAPGRYYVYGEARIGAAAPR